MSFLDTMRDILKSERRSSRPQSDWLNAWRQLAKLTYGITKDDPRFEPVIDALASCDMAYLACDWDRFQKAADQVRIALRLVH